MTLQDRPNLAADVFENQIDRLPRKEGSVRPTQGCTLAVMHVDRGSQSFNVVDARIDAMLKL